MKPATASTLTTSRSGCMPSTGWRGPRAGRNTTRGRWNSRRPPRANRPRAGGRRKAPDLLENEHRSLPRQPRVHGQHDPLDGLITYQQLQAGIGRFGEVGTERGLTDHRPRMMAACEGMEWADGGPPDVGGLLTDACTTQRTVLENLPETERLRHFLHDAENEPRELGVKRILSSESSPFGSWLWVGLSDRTSCGLRDPGPRRIASGQFPQPPRAAGETHESRAVPPVAR